MNARLQRILAFLGFVLLATAVGYIYFYRDRLTVTSDIFLFFGGILVAVYAYFIYSLISRNPTPVRFGMAGFSNAGKTVYLTVLYDRLQRAEVEGLRFSPYGLETIERTTEDLSTLSSGKWLPSTPVGKIFPYTAMVSIGGIIIKSLSRRFKIEIGDYAGDHTAEFDPKDERWLHKSGYFDYITKSDGIFLAIDTDYLTSNDIGQIDEMQNAFVALIQILAELKGATQDIKFSTPVALLFLKTDLIADYFLQDKLQTRKSELTSQLPFNTSSLPEAIEPEHQIILDEYNMIIKQIEDREFSHQKALVELQSKIPRLIEVCNRRCKNFELFYVSSVGWTQDNKKPPRIVKPVGVVAPLAWMLKNF